MEKSKNLHDDEIQSKPETKRKKHNSALLAVAKARSGSVHRAANFFSEGHHPIGTNISYKKGGGVL